MSELVFENVHKAFGPKPVLKGLSARIPMTGLTYVVGRSGSGKSVLCRLAVGLLRPDEGQVESMGRPVSRMPESELLSFRAQTPYIVQGPALLDFLTVEENVALAGRGLPKEICRQRTQAALAQLALTPWAQHVPPMLGPGLKKRAAIARALVLEPCYLLLDEPTTGLDVEASRQVNEALVSLKSWGLGALVVSHDYAALEQTADRVLLVDAGRTGFFGTREAFFASSLPEVVSLREPEKVLATEV